MSNSTMPPGSRSLAFHPRASDASLLRDSFKTLEVLAALGFAPTAVGIDIRLVARIGILPVIDTAIAHREPGHAKIGGGIVRPPMACFTDALLAFAETYGLQ